MSLTPDPYLMRVTGEDLTDSRTVIVNGTVEQINRHRVDLRASPTSRSRPEQSEKAADAPKPYKLAALVDWLVVCGCMLTLAVLSVPELREAAAQAIGQFIAR